MKRLFALLLAAVLMLSMVACGNDASTPTAPNATTEPTNAGDGETTETTKAPLTEEEKKLYARESYSADADAVAAAIDTVVATAGDAELTNGMLQVYFWLDLYTFVNDYSSYLSYFGLDYTAPLDEQECPEGEGSWQHYFLETGLQSWQNYQALALMAEEENVPMDPVLQQDLDDLEKTMADTAKQNNYDSIDAMLRAEAGPGCNFEAYEQYMRIYHLGYSYFNAMYNKIEVTDAMVEDYFSQHEAELKEQEITKDGGKVHDVRHILVEISGGTENEEGQTVYSDADWGACKDEAQKLLDQWLAGDATEESFAALATEHTADTGSAADGGLYTDLNEETNFVEEFKNWYLEEGRAKGDYGLVKSSYGYHIMYYSDTAPQWYRTCRNGVLDEKTAEIVEKAVEKFPMKVDYDAILIGQPDFDEQ